MHSHVYAISPMLELPLYVAYGVTNVRDMMSCPMPGDPFIACPEDKRCWSDEAKAGERIGPRIVASTSFMANGPGMLDRMAGLPEFYGKATPEQARAFVRHFAGKVEAIKVYDRIPREAYFESQGPMSTVSWNNWFWQALHQRRPCMRNPGSG